MEKETRLISAVAADAPPRAKPTSPPFPPEMVAKVAPGRDKRPLGDLFGLTNFGVNLTRLAPGGTRRCATRMGSRTSKDVVFPEVGDRIAGDSVSYPDDDVIAVFGSDGKWKYRKKDGTPY
jgi:uncharacterized cupin superfamily protein